MRRLWSKAAGLLLAYPILCLPYICAESFASCLEWFQHLAVKRIVNWLPVTQSLPSVLIGRVNSPVDVSVVLLWAARLTASIRWARNYADSCVFTTATVFTAILVDTLLREESLAFSQAWARLRSYVSRILFYSLKSWFLTLVLYIAVLVTDNRLRNMLAAGSTMRFVTIAAVNLLDVLCFAWIMAPIMVDLLRPVGSTAPADPTRKLGRYVFLITVIASFTFRRLLDPLLAKLTFEFRDHQDAIFGLASLIVDSPYVLLYIALALLAADASLDSGDKEIFQRQKFLLAVMPLHFREKQEP